MSVELFNGDCLEYMRGMEAGSVDCVFTDIPYYGIVGDKWDNQGSGTAGVACVELGRDFIGCDNKVEYFEIAQSRIGKAKLQPALFLVEQPKATQESLL